MRSYVKSSPSGKMLRALRLACLFGLSGLPGASGTVQAAERPSSREPVTILLYGDSLMSGYGLAAGQGFAAHMQRTLDARDGGIDLRNASLAGETTGGGLARLAWTLQEPADALVIALGANDMLRGFDPARTESNLRMMLATAREQKLPVLLVGVRAIANYGPGYARRFEGLYPALAQEFGTLFYPDFLAGVAGKASKNQRDGIHPNGEGTADIVKRIAPLFVRLADRVRLESGRNPEPRGLKR